MKSKSKSICTILFLFLFSIFTSCIVSADIVSADASVPVSAGLTVAPTTRTEYTDSDDIEELVTQYDLPFSADEISMIVISTDTSIVENISRDAGPTPRLDPIGPSEYFISNVVQEGQYRGDLIRSSRYAAPGGTMTADNSVQATYTCGVELDAAVISVAVGFDVTGSYNVSDSQTVVVEDNSPSGYAWVYAYANMMRYSFDVMDKDIWFDDYICSGEASLPIGVIFVILQSTDIGII